MSDHFSAVRVVKVLASVARPKTFLKPKKFQEHISKPSLSDAVFLFYDINILIPLCAGFNIIC